MSFPYLHSETVHNLTGPREVVPLVMQLVKPKSVLDVGCGTGTWLKVFEEQGVTDYLGIDGDYLDKSLLKIKVDNFIVHDLQQPFSLHRKFDMVVSLEVAEHLNERCADQFVQTLAAHGESILFSAAIPGQGGQNHLNEQWPEYWQKKFEQHGFYYHDRIRPLIWDNKKVDLWYRQNIFLLLKERPLPQFSPRAIIHHELYKLTLFNNADMLASLNEGRQGIIVGAKIFFNSFIFKFRNWFHL